MSGYKPNWKQIEDEFGKLTTIVPMLLRKKSLKFLSREYSVELKNIPFFEWSVHKGLMKMGDAFLDTQDILKVLTYISGTIDQGVYLLRGFKPFLENTEVQSHLISLVDRLNNDESALFFTGKGAHLEDPLKSHIASLTLPLPTENELLKLLKQIYQDLSQKIKSKSIFQKRIWKY